MVASSSPVGLGRVRERVGGWVGPAMVVSGGLGWGVVCVEVGGGRGILVGTCVRACKTVRFWVVDGSCREGYN